MLKSASCLIILLLLVGCGQRPGPTKARAEKDPRIAAIEDKIAKNTPEANQIVEKIRAMKPEVNEQVSAKSLDEIVEDYATTKGTYNINKIGWEGSQKKNGRWKILLHYQDYQKNITAAEWEYNPETNKLYPFEYNNAPGFWTGGGAESESKDKKAKK